MVKTMKKKPQPTRSNKKYPPEFRSEALKLAEKVIFPTKNGHSTMQRFVAQTALG